MILKRRLDICVALIIGGACVACIGFGSAYLIGLYAGLVPAAFGLLGLFWIKIGTATLLNRKHCEITINDSGITLPTGNVLHLGEAMHIPRAAITTIAKEETIRGRFIAVILRNGQKVPVQARNYCDLNKFLALCQANGLPTN